MAEPFSSSSRGLSPLSGASVPLRVAVSEVAEPAHSLCCLPSCPSLPSAAPECRSPRANQPGCLHPLPRTALGMGLSNRWWSHCWSGESNCDLIGTFSPSLRLARTLGSSWSWVLALRPVLYSVLGPVAWPWEPRRSPSTRCVEGLEGWADCGLGLMGKMGVKVTLSRARAKHVQLLTASCTLLRSQ